jgi:sugar/nucleoside kinase (ribokinase family)
MAAGDALLVFATVAPNPATCFTASIAGMLAIGVGARSEKGCVVASADGVIAVPAFPLQKLVDTTGAGDLFAAGFLFGLVRGVGHENAGRLGGLAAAEVIQHIGARPQVSLKELAKKNGLPV